MKSRANKCEVVKWGSPAAKHYQRICTAGFVVREAQTRPELLEQLLIIIINQQLKGPYCLDGCSDDAERWVQQRHGEDG
jgi:hypothetical protein